MPPLHGPDIFGLSFKVILLTFLASVHILLTFLVSVHILWNVVVKQGPWYHWYPKDAKHTPNGIPLQMNIMTHNLVPKANFASQTRVNGSPSIARSSSVEETNQA